MRSERSLRILEIDMTERNEKRDALLEAALELFSEKGFHAAPISLIAQKAGVGVGTIYRYFKDKDELIHELFRELLARVRAMAFADGVENLAVRERFLLVFTRILKFFLECPREFKFLEQYHYSAFSTPESLDTESDESAKKLLIRAREEGAAKDVPLAVLEAIAFGPIVALAKDHSNRSLAIDEEIIRLTVEAAWDGLKK
jgi:TetR/AcrR family transcriptional regulator, repressor of fatR-cypB operon